MEDILGTEVCAHAKRNVSPYRARGMDLVSLMFLRIGVLRNPRTVMNTGIVLFQCHSFFLCVCTLISHKPLQVFDGELFEKGMDFINLYISSA